MSEESLEQKINLPKKLENKYETEDSIYVGEAGGLYFDGNSVRGYSRLTKYSSTDFGLNVSLWLPSIKLGPKKVYSVRSGPFNHKYFIFNGEAMKMRTNGHRKDLAGELANGGINISDEVLDGVFGPIDGQLMDIYEQFFPPQIVEGEVKEVVYATAGIMHRPVTLYTVNGEGRNVNVGLEGLTESLHSGDWIRVEFDNNKVIASDKGNSNIEVLPNQVQVVPIDRIGYAITSYQKLNNGSGEGH
jgi:hypothetical protein